MFEKVVVCLDGSGLAEQILPYVTEGALRFNTNVVLLQVLDVPTTYAWIEGTAPEADIVTKESRREEEEAKGLPRKRSDIAAGTRAGRGDCGPTPDIRR